MDSGQQDTIETKKYGVIPETIKNHRYSEIFGQWWREVNIENGIIVIAVCGELGTGKSMITLLLMWLLDRDSQDNSYFSDNKISFKASEFLEWLNTPKEDWRRGSVIALDDAGLHLYNRDSLTEFVKSITKTMQNIRMKHPIIILNLPSFQMLDKHGRELTNIYIEAVNRDDDRKENFVKIHWMRMMPFDGTSLRYNIFKSRVVKHPILGIDIRHKDAVKYRIELPPKKIITAYEQKKSIDLSKFNLNSLQRLRAIEERMTTTGSGKRTNYIDYDVLEAEARKRMGELKKDANGNVNVVSLSDVLNVGNIAARRVALRLNKRVV